MMLGATPADVKTYVDDVFSTYVYTGTGTGSVNTINNGINLSGEGGMVWIKNRDSSASHAIWDSVRGAGTTTSGTNAKALASNLENAQGSLGGTIEYLSAFNSNGFSLAAQNISPYNANGNGVDFSSWTFRKAIGLCDIVTYVGNGSNRTISHSLGCVPGMIILKNLDATDHWVVYHRGNVDSNNAAHYALRLNTTGTKADAAGYFQDTLPTATEFTLGTDSDSNGNGENFIAYIFAGGSANSQDLARSVQFNGSSDELTWGSTTDYEFGQGDFTWEAWIKPTSWTTNAYNTLFMVGGASQNGGFWIGQNNGNQFVVRAFSDQDLLIAPSNPPRDKWTHVAVSRSGTTLKLFYNGVEQKSVTSAYDFQSGTTARLANDGHNQRFAGKVSNLRIVKGTAVYTSNFYPSDSLTNITNTKLLCCNNSSVTGSTVTPTAISDGGSTASSDSPIFTDQAANVFGENEDQGLIKCGSYTGNGNASNGTEVELGWEPSWLLVKCNDTDEHWGIIDSMRKLTDGGSNVLFPNLPNGEDANANSAYATPYGFKLATTNNEWNGNNKEYVFMAIRRSDGYVGKPPSAGTDVFNVVAGVTGPPSFVTNFVADMGFWKSNINTVSNWNLNARIMGQGYLKTNNTDQQADGGTNMIWDLPNGFSKNNSSIQVASVFKRHAGFDVVNYRGTSSSDTSGEWQVIPHNLAKVPEMIIVKIRDGGSGYWGVYHNALNGGTTPWNYRMLLNGTNSESDGSSSGYTSWYWNDTAPTATHFNVGEVTNANYDGGKGLALLFASVDGISKVGSYTGNSGSSQTITTGFQPRFLMVKSASSSSNWTVLDTIRGWSGGDDERLYLNRDDAQSSHDVGSPTSTGFIINSGWDTTNDVILYYAHA